jgi:hypothetical protein
MFLVVVDGHSKWIDVEIVKSTDAGSTVSTLRKLFSTHGLPRVIVSDNGPGFASEEFNTFLERNGVKHLYSAPYHPSSNGQAERTVRTFKEALKKLSEGDVETKLSRFLFRYRVTPHTLTGVSPAELLFKRRLRTALTLLRPEMGANLRDKQLESMVGQKRRSFRAGEEVWARNFRVGEKWLPGVVMEVMAATNYKVLLLDGRVMHRHIDQLAARHVEPEVRRRMPAEMEVELQQNLPGVGESASTPQEAVGQSEPELIADSVPPAAMPTPSQEQTSCSAIESSPGAENVPQEPPMELRRSTRDRKRPGYLEAYC